MKKFDRYCQAREPRVRRNEIKISIAVRKQLLAAVVAVAAILFIGARGDLTMNPYNLSLSRRNL